MSDSEFITKLLDIKQPMEYQPNRYSTITLLLIGARKLFGCNLETGKYEKQELNETNFTDGTYHSFQFSGLINYLIFLEQIGSIFRPKNPISALTKSNGIYCALKYFSELSCDTKIGAIVSLRNSLAHKFGLATEKNPKSKPPRKFILSSERNQDVVNLPIKDWDGVFSDKSDTTSTTIYIIDLVNEIEKVYKQLKEENSKNNLEILLKDELCELKARYTIIS